MSWEWRSTGRIALVTTCLPDSSRRYDKSLAFSTETAASLLWT